MKLTDHLEKLKYFYEVASTGSLKGASKVVHISQPSLTKSIKILEDVVGSNLFVRLPRGMKLTQEGEVLYLYCQNLFSSITDIEQKLAHPNDSLAGSLRIGTYDSIGIYFWPKFLQKFLLKYDKLDIQLLTGRSAEIQDKLDAGQIDIALIVNPKKSPGIEVDILNNDAFKLYESCSDKVYKKGSEAPIIAMPTASVGTETIRDILNGIGFGERKIYTTSTLESVKELTLHGIGMGLLPEMVAKSPLSSKKIREVKHKGLPKEGIGPHAIGIAYHSNRRNSKIIEVLIKEIKNHKL